jgi:hypothetical protein
VLCYALSCTWCNCLSSNCGLALRGCDVCHTCSHRFEEFILDETKRKWRWRRLHDPEHDFWKAVVNGGYGVRPRNSRPRCTLGVGPPCSSTHSGLVPANTTTASPLDRRYEYSQQSNKFACTSHVQCEIGV